MLVSSIHQLPRRGLLGNLASGISSSRETSPIIAQRPREGRIGRKDALPAYRIRVADEPKLARVARIGPDPYRRSPFGRPDRYRHSKRPVYGPAGDGQDYA